MLNSFHDLCLLRLAAKQVLEFRRVKLSSIYCEKRTLLMLCFALLVFPSCTSKKEAQKPQLVIHTYSSFTSEWGLQSKVIPPFEEKYRCRVKIVGVDDTGAMLSRLLLEGKKTDADVVIGIDNNLIHRALKADILLPYKPAAAGMIPKELVFDPSWHVTPFDYNHYAFIYDSQKLATPPKSLRELASARFRKKIILEDPRTSTPGLGFLLWSVSIFKEDYQAFWRELAPNLLTIAPGWDMAYGMFTRGEAPIVLSYATSPAFHLIYDKTDRYRAAIFEEGHYFQIEGAGILASTDQPELAKAFIDYMLTLEFQRFIPMHNYMFPVNPEAKLPKEFAELPLPKKGLSLRPAEIGANFDRWLSEWRAALK